MRVEGGCRCGAVRYVLAAERVPPVYCCHCTDCQSWTGSAFSEQAAVREEALSVSGPIADYHYTTPSGMASHHRMCALCHARIYNTNARMPGMALLRAGTLDDSAGITPAAHIWTASKQPWVTLPEHVPAWPQAAPQEAFVALLVSAS